MATTWDAVRRIALALPEVTERPSYDARPAWRVKDTMFAWERPLGRADVAALRDAVPSGDILGVRVTDLDAKEALLPEDPGIYFTIPHFNGYPALLVRLDRIGPDELTEVLTEAWLARAPKRLAKTFLEGRL